MATHKSAIKRHRQSLNKRERNRAVKSKVKTVAKKALTAMEGKDADSIKNSLREAVTCIDKAASKGVIHHRTASRKVSRLSKRAHKAAGV